MSLNARKMVAPIAITAFVALYYGVIVRLLLLFSLPPVVRGAIILIPAIIVLALSFVLWERIKEIRSGEEDDLSKY